MCHVCVRTKIMCVRVCVRACVLAACLRTVPVHQANTREKRAVFAFRGTTDFADVSICSDANILPLYDDVDVDAPYVADEYDDIRFGTVGSDDDPTAVKTSAEPGANTNGPQQSGGWTASATTKKKKKKNSEKVRWKRRPFERSRIHRGIRDAVLWLIHQEGLLKYAKRFADAGYKVGGFRQALRYAPRAGVCLGASSMCAPAEF